MSELEQDNILIVQPSEGGQKLLQFLVRRLGLPQSLLHRWIRTGQIRVNGSRIKPFVHVQNYDAIRLPPFAKTMINFSAHKKEEYLHTNLLSSTSQNSDLPPIIYSDEHVYVFDKPYGLPVHRGTGHVDSLATRLAMQILIGADNGEGLKQDTFRPTPAHRLDKDTSGVILVARSYACLRALQGAFENRNITKEYLAWVHGYWPFDEPKRLWHNMAKQYMGYDERVRILFGEQGRESESLVTCLRRVNNCSLMHIKLITGRTHQIRVQLAAEGFAVFGDGKYGKAQEGAMHLHALRITLPSSSLFDILQLSAKSFSVLPAWQGWQAVGEVLDIV